MRSYLKKPWGHTPFVPAETALYGAMHVGFEIPVVRISVADGFAGFQWLLHDASDIVAYRAIIAKRGQSVGFANNRPADIPEPQVLPPDVDTCAFSGLQNEQDYEITIVAYDEKGLPVARSLCRLFRCGDFPGHVVNYIHPDDYAYGFSGRSPASPSIAKLKSGALLISHDVFWGQAGQLLTQLFRSDDDGKSWRYVTDICPCFWGKLFVHADALYMMGMSQEYGDVLIGKSTDEGKTWSKPVLLLEGGDRLTGGPHQAPTPILITDTRIYSAVEWGAWSEGNKHASGVLSADSSSDLMDPASWVLSPYVSHDATWPGAVTGGNPQMLEGNLFQMQDGRIGNLLRYHTKDANPPEGQAVLLALDPGRPELPQAFVRVQPLDGGYTKFHVQRDERTGKLYLLHNGGDAQEMYRRDVLSLSVSEGDARFTKVCDVIDDRNNDHTEGPQRVGFQYPSFILESGEILAAIRTAMHGAWNYHNANTITFHRISI